MHAWAHAHMCSSQTGRIESHGQLPSSQVEATKGALWDAFAEMAIYMEVLHVQVGTASRGLFSGEHCLPA